MNIFGLLTMLGGLALFLYGMKTMGDGLVMLSGGRLEIILEKLTGNRFRALLLGTAVTAVIQSSSATTVMVVGLVNSGIMKLSQATGIIMGANIGTTATSWILSLTGISSTNVLVQLLKPSSFSPVLATIGIVCVMTGNDGSKKKTVGNILLGFSILMYGMETMSSAVSPLKQNAAFIGWFTLFSNPLAGVLAGALLTAVIQSSSASVGILQALCMSGAVTYGAAIPIIMGQNIGTCITAMISSIGAGKNAKSAAFIHLYFNLIGTACFMVTFYLLNVLFHFSFLAENAGAAGVALIHSLFNIGSALLLFPFGNDLVALAEYTVGTRKSARKEKPVSGEAAVLDERFLETPSFAVRLCRDTVMNMAEHTNRAMRLSMELQNGFAKEKMAEVKRIACETDTLEDILGAYLVRLAGKDLSREDGCLLTMLLRTVPELGRIADNAVRVAAVAEKMQYGGLSFSQGGKQELESINRPLRSCLNLLRRIIKEEDPKSNTEVILLKKVINDMVTEMKRRHIERLSRGQCSMETGLMLEDILTSYEKVADHCFHIALVPGEAVEASQSEYLRLKNIYTFPDPVENCRA